MDCLGELSEKEMQLSPSDPIIIELNRLENHLREKERELEHAYREVKALKTAEVLKDKALIELSNELSNQDEKIRHYEEQLEQKNLEIQKLFNEKREALAAQFAAEATLRRVYAAQEDEEFVPVEAVIAPLESDIKRYKYEIALLLEDKKALERITKSKEAALVEAGNILRSALERALIVEDVQNKNIELRRQIEICQEENKVLEKTNRQKILEVEKLTQTIHELEESVLASGTAANAVRDYQRQVSELKDEKKTLERELSRIKVFVNRVASIAANEWKDEGDKVMPVKKWLEERRFMQGEIQRLRNKMSMAEKTAKVESQLNEKLRTRLKTLEDGLRNVSRRSVSIKESNYSEKVTEKRSKTQSRQSFSPKLIPRPNLLLFEGSERKEAKTPKAFKSRKSLLDNDGVSISKNTETQVNHNVSLCIVGNNIISNL
ncbi:Microtubule-associated protein 70-4 [Rhynchospora pubera]|uniref:Microtubule-associated protein 70-4 n=1 Tax=Rhynchospora pubera TaxID=906938 RepID=A0AAV8G2C8_9POAL|nr:Microtubule-associated protein 70-4 [Rhynchospora pubera]